MVKIKQVGLSEEGLPIFEATEIETGELIQVKNWFEKSKNKWHIVLGPNSANRKYIAHNEFNSKKDANDEYIVEDKTTAPRVMGTAQPDAWAKKYMTEEELADYNAIIERAMERRAQEIAANKSQPKTEIEKLEAKIKKLEAQIAKAKAEEALTSREVPMTNEEVAE